MTDKNIFADPEFTAADIAAGDSGEWRMILEPDIYKPYILREKWVMLHIEASTRSIKIAPIIAKKLNEYESLKRKQKEIGLYLAHFCQKKCPINNDPEFGANLPNPEDCQMPAICDYRAIWRILKEE